MDTSLDDWTGWVGREETLRARIDAAPVAALAATLDLEGAPTEGQPLPPGWHWLFFNPVARQSALGDDGHPRRAANSFLPPINLPRRMWAGSRIRYLASLQVGAEAERSSRILRITPKEGKSGPMCFVTVAHSVASGGRTCIEEEQDIVYRAATPLAPASGGSTIPERAVTPAPLLAPWKRTVNPDAVLLFRYSALTFNGHRIHYDLPYAQVEEGYRGLVVHGPLAATLLQGFAASLRPGLSLAAFEFRGMQPLFAGQPFTLCADEAGKGALALHAVAPDGRVAVEAFARFAPQS
ncbi:MaoC family dehydratase N-terminal domain-containing protein [Cupriavidus basilensis]|uniref:MaoC family dehydratase N-terminal domain-containing protein n=1 Tax=Cupriavidus basilensis TaxID=68895 RepID=A0ABT6AKV7_9BURK|nr:MaoC family dehydratase N-terminal domain-containing protein [Cupriavidus basilensis]MDF3833223.1 MaoC family dehydratase N-terminal domain-containing protein [Cupriavidus basilensis]